MTHAGWLRAPEPAGPGRRLGPALGASLIFHGLMAALVLLMLSVAPPASTVPPLARMLDVVYLPSATPVATPAAGGGGGNPRPAPPQPTQIVRSDAPAITPAPTPVDPPPSIQAHVETSNATFLSSTGTTLNAPPGPGGGKAGTGVGGERGSGAGPGPGGPGTGDSGFGTVGVDATEPVPVFSPQPDYTSEAMLAKVQGDVQLDVVILANGRVGDVKVVKAPKPAFGLDEKAIATAKRWLFKPSLRKGVPVPVRVTIILTFTLR